MKVPCRRPKRDGNGPAASENASSGVLRALHCQGGNHWKTLLRCQGESLIPFSLCLCLVAGDFYDHHLKKPENIVKEETIGKLYSDVKVDLVNDKYYFHVLKKQHEDGGNGPIFSEDYQKVSAKIIPLKSYVVADKYGHKKVITDYEIPYKVEWGVEQKLPIVQRTPIKHY
ncbi:unnamed protein product [Cyprideis torosa]|uniref:Uncharacterized protein n=1 Tax=Cyprideis torosa TaxID=163714 RepID=A0A7R8WI52_9CRUS|nr:unnamed protein product [Cyprideis torosa]CAG0900299.1 unnamed protein product [Cyprideis torosa]